MSLPVWPSMTQCQGLVFVAILRLAFLHRFCQNSISQLSQVSKIFSIDVEWNKRTQPLLAFERTVCVRLCS